MASTQPQPSQNGINSTSGLLSPEQGKLSSDDEGVRLHTSSSVSRTRPNSNWTPPTDNNDMESIKQKIDFSDDAKHDHHLSATPPPVLRPDQHAKLAMSAPPSLSSSRRHETTPTIGNDSSSEDSVDTILSRLETVKSYTEDARSLYQQLQAHEDEPGTTEQMERVSVLINQLKQQELSYLQVLLKIMEDEKIADGQLGEVEQMMSRNSLNYGQQDEGEEEEEEDDDDEGEQQEEEEEGEGLGEKEREGSNDSLSLRAEMMKGNDEEVEDGGEEDLAKEFVDQQRELEALHEQRALLMKLQEQQSQLVVLQERQSQLLRLKKEAEERLSEAEKQCDELGDVSLEYSHDADGLTVAEEEKKGVASPFIGREKQLMVELEELKKKKKQAESLMGQLSTMKGAPPESLMGQLSTTKGTPPESLMGQLSTTKGAPPESLMGQLSTTKEAPPESLMGQLSTTIEAPPESLMGQLSTTTGAPPESLMGQLSTMKGASPKNPEAFQNQMGVAKPQDELVDSHLQDLKSKMKQIENARRKMKELQDMVGMLQGAASTNQQSSPKGKTNGKPQPQESGSRKPKATVDNLDDSQDDEVIQLLADYEKNIGKRQRELDAIKKQKEELKRVEEMLQDLQLMTESAKKKASASGHYGNVLEEEVGEESEDEREVSRRLNMELSKQRDLYEDLKRKTQQLKQLQQDIEKLSRASDHESAIADTTIATWGGSSVASMMSTAMDDETRESTDPNLPQYQVDRHTPRHSRPLRRAYSPHDEQDSTIGKKIKLEPQSSGGLGTPTVKKTTAGLPLPHQTPSVSKRSAVWPAVIFSQSANKPSVGKVQTPPSFHRPKGSIPTPATAIPNDYTLLLKQQLSNSSAMCFQLMEHQSSLLQALNQKLDTLPHIQEQMIQLHEYHDHLQGYHEYLNSAYWQLMEYSKRQEVDQERQEQEGGRDKDLEEEEEEEQEQEQGGDPVGDGDQRRHRSFPDDPLSTRILPPPHPLSLINSPYQRPTNPHLQASPDTKRFRPITRPPGYPYSLYGSAAVDSNYLPEVVPGVGLTQDQQTQCEGIGATSNTGATANPLEVGSTSSLPDKPDPEAPGGTTVFDTLRDTVYSEVAALIANNENRPHFLVELFRELQQLNTDYLRQRALYSIQDLVTRFLKDDDAVDPDNQEAVDVEDKVPPCASKGNGRVPIPTKRANSQRFDYSEVVESASSVSTPPVMEEPFASDALGDTIIKMEKQQQHVRDTSSDLNDNELDTTLLDEEIKDVMTNIIPLLKQHLADECSPDLLDTIKTTVVNMVLTKEDTQSAGDLGTVFTEQLITSLSTIINKYRGKTLKDCGEDLLVDVSEVLFNEIAFFRLIKDSKGVSGKDYYQSVTSGSQTTTDLESATNSPQRPVINSLTLQSLGSVISQSLQDESESLGNDRDDELAKTWRSHQKQEEDGQDKTDQCHDREDDGDNERNEQSAEKKGENVVMEDGYVHVTSGSTTPPPTGENHQMSGSPSSEPLKEDT